MQEISNTQQVLQACTVHGKIIKLPDAKLDRKIYESVARLLEGIGGKWSRKSGGFQFIADPTELLDQIVGGEKRNLKKEFQFFGTPDKLADYLVFLANIYPSHKVLEPSAGQGSIVDAIIREGYNDAVDCYELMPQNRIILEKKAFVNLFAEPDFLKDKATPTYDRIVANPPFSKNQDIDHILHMYSFLKRGGRLVSIASPHWEDSSNKKESEFRVWLNEVDATVEVIDKGAFKQSGTMIETRIVTINKD